MRGALARGISRINHQDDAAFAVCANMVNGESNATARETMARYLADNLGSYPAGRAALEQLVKNEQTSSIRTYVIGELRRSNKTSRTRPKTTRK